MIVIVFNKGRKKGGLGDRIVALISCKLIAKLLNKKFYISWTRENIYEYINYSKYDFELLDNVDQTNIKLYSFMNHTNHKVNDKLLKDYLMTEKNIFPNKINKFYLNINIIQYLYKNDLFKHFNYYNDILNEYKKLYTHILKPTDKLKLRINELVKDNTNIIGIQIRTGDKGMITNQTDFGGKNGQYAFQYPQFRNINVENKIYNILSKIKDYCDKNNNYDRIFITSDYNDIYKISIKIWDNNKIIYNHDIIQHLDRAPVDNNISKIFVDSYILSQKTNMLFISDYSNYGQISACSAVHDNIYNLDCKKIYKKNLLNK